MKVIGIIGTRRRNDQGDFWLVRRKFFEVYEEGDVICSGCCPQGADRFADLISNEHKIKGLWFPPDWKRYGRGAGFVRNTDIAKASDILIACVASDRKGGTEDTIKKFIKFHGETNLYYV